MKNLNYIIFLSAVAALGGFLFGYDTAVISGTIKMVTQQFNLNAQQEGWYVGCALVGSIFGVAVAGMISDKFGRKISLLISAFLFTLSALGCAISGDVTELVIYRIVGGIGIGVASIISPLYISEIAVAKYRGRLVSLYQLAVTVGFLAAYLVNFQLLKTATPVITDNITLLDKILNNEIWRGMLGAETLPAILFFIILFLIPESPRWLVLQNKTDKAVKVFTRFTNPLQAVGEVETIRNTVIKNQQSEWSFLLKPKILKLVLTGAIIAMLGQFMGVNAVLYYGPKIFQDSGLSSGDSLFYQVLVGAVNVVTTIIALLIIDKVGRKKLVYFGVTGMIMTLLLIAAYFMFGTQYQWSTYLLLTFFLGYIFCCAISICAVVFVLLSEMFPSKVRGLAMSVAGLSLWIGTYLIGQLTPILLENIKPVGTFLLFAAACIPYILLIRFSVPETTGKTLEEIEKELNVEE